MSSTGSRKNNRDTDFVWNFVTVQQKQENNEWKDAEPGFVGSNKDRCTCLFCGKQFSAQAHRIRAHVGQLKGNDVFLCTFTVYVVQLQLSGFSSHSGVNRQTQYIWTFAIRCLIEYAQIVKSIS